MWVPAYSCELSRGERSLAETPLAIQGLCKAFYVERKKGALPFLGILSRGHFKPTVG